MSVTTNNSPSQDYTDLDKSSIQFKFAAFLWFNSLGIMRYLKIIDFQGFADYFLRPQIPCIIRIRLRYCLLGNLRIENFSRIISRLKVRDICCSFWSSLVVHLCLFHLILFLVYKFSGNIENQGVKKKVVTRYLLTQKTWAYKVVKLFPFFCILAKTGYVVNGCVLNIKICKKSPRIKTRNWVILKNKMIKRRKWEHFVVLAKYMLGKLQMMSVTPCIAGEVIQRLP